MKRAILLTLMLAGVAFAADAPPPHIDNVTPNATRMLANVTINGTGFGDTAGTSKVVFVGADGGGQNAPVRKWSSSAITVTVPPGIWTSVEVTVAGKASNSVKFTITGK